MTLIVKTPRWLPLIAVALVVYVITGIVIGMRHRAEPPSSTPAIGAASAIPTGKRIRRRHCNVRRRAGRLVRHC